MIHKFIDAMFGCWHSNYSFPQTAKASGRRLPAAQATGTYVVCLDCGKEFSYDWHKMKVVGSEPEYSGALVTVGEEFSQSSAA